MCLLPRIAYAISTLSNKCRLLPVLFRMHVRHLCISVAVFLTLPVSCIVLLGDPLSHALFCCAVHDDR